MPDPLSDGDVVEALREAWEVDKAESRRTSVDPDHPDSGAVATAQLRYATRQGMDALLARLDAAEKVCEAALVVIGPCGTAHMNDLVDALAAWRQLRGTDGD